MVTLACIPTAVFYFLPLAIGKFNELYPNIKVRILEQGTNYCMESVLCNESDFWHKHEQRHKFIHLFYPTGQRAIRAGLSA
ncbi:LysR substrate-binding domain-containing protein [Escherichia coli]